MTIVASCSGMDTSLWNFLEKYLFICNLDHGSIYSHIPAEFINENKDREEFWRYPLIPLGELRKKVGETKSRRIYGYILLNPSLFSEGMEEAEKLVATIYSKDLVSTVTMGMNLSLNVKAPIQFFIRNPQYVSWTFISSNRGEMFRNTAGDNEEVILSFLDREFKLCEKDRRWKLIQNPTVPLAFFERNVKKFDDMDLANLSLNPSVTLSWWKKNVESYHKDMKSYHQHDVMYSLAGKPSTPYSFVLDNLSECHTYYQSLLKATGYNTPVDVIMDIREEDMIHVGYAIARNSGFWIHLAERELTPILYAFFDVSSSEEETERTEN